MYEYDDSPEPLSCGHFPSGTAPEAWYITGPWDRTGGTGCRECAITADALGGHADLIPTNEQILTWLEWELAGIGAD